LASPAQNEVSALEGLDGEVEAGEADDVRREGGRSLDTSITPGATLTDVVVIQDM
jgi:hypothetical protein